MMLIIKSTKPLRNLNKFKKHNLFCSELRRCHFIITLCLQRKGKFIEQEGY